MTIQINDNHRQCWDSCPLCEELNFTHGHWMLNSDDQTDSLNLYTCTDQFSDHNGHVFTDTHPVCDQCPESKEEDPNV